MTLELIEAARLLGFDPAPGWPDTFAHDRLAALQSWRNGMERKDSRSKTKNWRELMELALASGAMEHTTTTERVQTTPPIMRTINPGFGSREWTERGFAGAQVESREFLGGTLITAYTQPARYREVTRHHITAPAFATWLAALGIEPSPHVAAWFKAQGVACPAPAPAQNTATPATPPAAPVENSASSAPAWTVTKPKRFMGYTAPLHRLLAAAHREGKPRPTAHDVLEEWSIDKPAEIAKVLTDGFDYYDANGNTKTAGLEAIRKAIDRMATAR